MTKVLVVDDKQMMRDSVGGTLQRAGYTVIVADEGTTALNMVARHRPRAVITDLKMPEMDGLELLARLRQADDQLPVIVMTAYGSITDAVKAMKDGAFDFIQKPFEGDQLIMTVRRAVEHRRLLEENAALRVTNHAFENSPNLVGRSPAMRQLAQQIQQIAQSHGTVLISGESGTGKEVVARTIHAHSPRRERIMLCLNCAALSGSLLESELFGHEKGAFTGADQLRKGRFELADAGTLLLDEISEITPTLQAKLLRVLQERQFERVGSSLTMQVDVRVIATTNRDLHAYAASGGFRQDLYYRLNVLPIHLPTLRQRLEDVPLLTEHFLDQVGQREGKEPKRFDEESLALMMKYPWPGNVRELQNICERASVLTRQRIITAGLIQPWLLPVPSVASAPRPASAMNRVNMSASMPNQNHAFHADDEQSNFSSSVMTDASHPTTEHAIADHSSDIRSLEELERNQIIRTLGQFNGNRARTAAALGIGLRTLGLKLKKWKEQNLVAQTL